MGAEGGGGSAKGFWGGRPLPPAEDAAPQRLRCTALRTLWIVAGPRMTGSPSLPSTRTGRSWCRGRQSSPSPRASASQRAKTWRRSSATPMNCAAQ